MQSDEAICSSTGLNNRREAGRHGGVHELASPSLKMMEQLARSRGDFEFAAGHCLFLTGSLSTLGDFEFFSVFRYLELKSFDVFMISMERNQVGKYCH